MGIAAPGNNRDQLWHSYAVSCTEQAHHEGQVTSSRWAEDVGALTFHDVRFVDAAIQAQGSWVTAS